MFLFKFLRELFITFITLYDTIIQYFADPPPKLLMLKEERPSEWKTLPLFV